MHKKNGDPFPDRVRPASCSICIIPTLALPKSGRGSKRFIFLSACLIRKLPVFSLCMSDNRQFILSHCFYCM